MIEDLLVANDVVERSKILRAINAQSDKEYIAMMTRRLNDAFRLYVVGDFDLCVANANHVYLGYLTNHSRSEGRPDTNKTSKSL
jgi:hypothetical protein